MELKALFTPEMFKMENYPSSPIAVFNPAAFMSSSDEMIIFPRLIFDTRFYTSSIGIFRIPFNMYFPSLKTISTTLLATPTNAQDFKGLEDPRITEDGKKFLHVALNNNTISHTVLSNFTAGDLYNFRTLEIETEIVPNGRDAAIINDDYLVFRPELKKLESYSVPYEQDGTIDFKNAKVVLSPLKFELKRGFSTNVVKLSSNEFLIGWHAILRQNLEYANGFMILNNVGEVISMSEPFFRLPQNYLRYGNRPNTLFGCGLILRKNKLWWIGGIGDWAIGVFSAELEDVLNKLK